MILVCQISTHEKVNQVNALNHQCLSPRLSLTHLWIIKSKRSRTFTLAYDDSIRYTYNAKHVADYVLILRGTNLERCVGAVVLWHCKNVEYGECSEFWSEKYRSGSESRSEGSVGRGHRKTGCRSTRTPWTARRGEHREKAKKAELRFPAKRSELFPTREGPDANSCIDKEQNTDKEDCCVWISLLNFTFIYIRNKIKINK